ncbi:ATP-binding protein [Mycoplasma tullyi]|uniref:Chromosomal replication initiator protein DnaA n=1 Tax=Mycoplasma tullyi TaxID=1612150 RepID=A0A7D7U3R7_9MOLU|nr:DnaA/Hda family protein [Mycoplasma tullyi]QMT98531.1 ATP-binding protein [Mycoplasma tullyi]
MKTKLKRFLEEISVYFNEANSELLDAFVHSIDFVFEENDNIYIYFESLYFFNEFKNRLNHLINVENTVDFNDFLSLEWKKIIKENKRISLLDKKEADSLKEKLANLKKQEKYKINPLSKGIKEKYNFNNYLVFEFNTEAVYLAKQIANKTIDQNWNPIIIEGKPGYGKSHLLQAIANERQRLFPEEKICVLSSDDFGSEFLKSVIAPDPTHIESFKSKYKDYDLLMIDDVQIISNRPKTNETFFTIFNSLVDQKKTIVITLDCKIEEIQDKLTARMISRFQKGINVRINKPNKNEIIQIFKQKFKENNLEKYVDDHVIQEISDFDEGDIRKIEGSVATLVFMNQMYGSTKTQDQILKSYIEKVTNRKNLILSKDSKYVFDKIKYHFNVSEEALKSSKRKKEIVQARHICMYILKNVYNKNLSQIGKLLKKDHTTVKHGIDKVEEDLENDPNLKSFLDLFKN